MNNSYGPIIDAHSHLLQDAHPADNLQTSVGQAGDFQRLLAGMDELGLTHAVTQSQEMTRVRGQWLGSNELCADLQRCSGGSLLGLACFEPMTPAPLPGSSRKGGSSAPRGSFARPGRNTSRARWRRLAQRRAAPL